MSDVDDVCVADSGATSQQSCWHRRTRLEKLLVVVVVVLFVILVVLISVAAAYLGTPHYHACVAFCR